MSESAQQSLVGALAGAVEVTAMQPTIAIKNALQERRPVPMSLNGLYRGYAINLSTVAPMSAVQFGTVSAYTELFKGVVGRSPNGKESVACAAAGGATSVLVAGPAELLVIQQQRAGIGAMEALKRVTGTYGLAGLFKGSPATATRDGLVVAGILGLCPAIVEELNELETTKDWRKSTKTAVGAVGSGIAGTLISMPFDACKTLQQAYLDKTANPEYATMRSTMAKIWADKGFLGIYSGTAPRGFRIICATFILNSVKGWAEGLIASLK